MSRLGQFFTPFVLGGFLVLNLLLPGCSSSGGGGGDGGLPENGHGTLPPDADPVSPTELVLSIELDASGTVLADALSSSGPIWTTLDSAVLEAGGAELRLPSELPVGVGVAGARFWSVLCPGAEPATAPSGVTVVLGLEELVLRESAASSALRRASKSGISLNDPNGWTPGDRVHHWLYVDQALLITTPCSYPGGVERSLNLSLNAGWNALVTELSGSGLSTRMASASDTDGWWVGATSWIEPEEALWLPASELHGARASWWGHNQSKLVRIGDRLFASVVDNASTPPQARVVEQVGGSWVEVGAWPSVAPAQVLAHGSDLLVLVFNETPSDLDTLGSISIVAFDAAGNPGEALVPESERYPGTEASFHTINVRFGATVDPSGVLVLSWGLTQPGENSPAAHSLYRATLDLNSADPPASWTGSSTSVEDPFRYPYLAQDESRFVSLSVENRFMGEGQENLYRMLRLEQESLTSVFATDVSVTDFTPLAPEGRAQLVRARDLHIDASGEAHALVQTYLDPNDAQRAQLRVGVSAAPPVLASGVNPSNDRPPSPILPAAPAWAWSEPEGFEGCGAPRLLMVAERPLAACLARSTLSIVELDGTPVASLRLPPQLLGPELFTAEGRVAIAGGASERIDLMVVEAAAGGYPNGPALVLSIDRALIASAPPTD